VGEELSFKVGCSVFFCRTRSSIRFSHGKAPPEDLKTIIRIIGRQPIHHPLHDSSRSDSRSPASAGSEFQALVSRAENGEFKPRAQSSRYQAMTTAYSIDAPTVTAPLPRITMPRARPQQLHQCRGDAGSRPAEGLDTAAARRKVAAETMTGARSQSQGRERSQARRLKTHDPAHIASPAIDVLMDDYLAQRFGRQLPGGDTVTGESPVPIRPRGFGGLTMNRSGFKRRLQCP